MKDLIEALQILLRYLENPDEYAPISCAHDVMYVCNVKVAEIDFDTIKHLYKLGFVPGYDENYNLVEDILGEDFDWDDLTKEDWDLIKNELDNCMYSYRFGSC